MVDCTEEPHGLNCDQLLGGHRHVKADRSIQTEDGKPTISFLDAVGHGNASGRRVALGGSSDVRGAPEGGAGRWPEASRDGPR